MQRLRIVATVGVAGGVALGGVCLAAQGPLPGDVAVTRALQSALGPAPAWADALTATAKAPALFVTLALATALAWLRGGFRAAAAPALALALAKLAELALRALVFAPKPTAELVAVASPSASSGLPSTFGLVYAGLFGAALLASGRKGASAVAAAVGSGLLVAAGGCARIVLGGHWTSQLLASLLVGLALAALAHRALAAAFPAAARKV
jgi:membrane-associated phospholipid phosphatase